MTVTFDILCQLIEMIVTDEVCKRRGLPRMGD